MNIKRFRKVLERYKDMPNTGVALRSGDVLELLDAFDEAEAELKAISVDIIEVTELEADGERLDWLSSLGCFEVEDALVPPNLYERVCINSEHSAPTLRQAIDKARKERQ